MLRGEAMRVLLFGGTGMIGQGVLRECLLAPDVDQVQTIGRTRTGVANSKLGQIVHDDLGDVRALENQLVGFDACFFCLGVSSAGLSEADYTRVTYDMALAVAQTLVHLNPQMTFVYVSGAGADSSGRGRVMWARVKGRTENALLSLPFRGVYVVRPGFVEPLHGVKSRTVWYRLFYAITAPLLPALRRLFPAWVLTTEDIGKAMLELARDGAPGRVLESRDVRALFRSAAASD
jgi:uncharacterized protein YbjT (DUF2867 family)